MKHLTQVVSTRAWIFHLKNLGSSRWLDGITDSMDMAWVNSSSW